MGIPHAERLLLVSLMLWVFSLLLARALIRRGLDHRAVVYTTFIGLLAVLTGGAVIRQSGPFVGWSLLILSVVLTALTSARMPGSVLPQVLIVAIAVAFASGPVIDAMTHWTQFGSSELLDLEPLSVSIPGGQDVYLILLDGFPGVESMDEEFGFGRGSELEESLESEGLIVPEEARASYPVTNFSVPSILEMDYPLTTEPTRKATVQGLYDVISGNNRVREVFSANEYDTYMVEPGWSGGSCRRQWYDHCIASSWFDDPMYQLIRDSVFNELVPGTAYHYALDSQRTMDWLEDNLPAMSRDGEPAFVFAHVLAPHAPFFLTPNCETDPDPDRQGFFFPRPGVPDEERDEFLEGQIDCLTAFMETVTRDLDDSALIVFAGDHGTDRHDQTAREPSTWSVSETEERMNPLVAARLPDDCSLDDDVYLPNLMREVISCISTTPVPEVEDETHLLLRDWTD